MNLPQITARIGSKQRQFQNPILSLVKKPKIELKEAEKAYILFMTFDLTNDQIFFEKPVPYYESHTTKYYYFGNNPAASLQSYVVRKVESLNYLLTSTWNDLYVALKQQKMETSNLGQLITELQRHSLITLGTKKGEGRVMLEKIFHPSTQKIVSIQLNQDKKSLMVNGIKYKFESFIRLLQEDENRLNRYLLVIPKIRRDEEEIILSQHPEYIQLIKKLNNIEPYQTSEGDSTLQRVCYLCHKRKGDVSSHNIRKFNRSGINKIFTVTTINSSRYLQKGYNYDDAYSLCGECYQDLLAGENVIDQRFKGMVAGESAFILPEGLMESFDYDRLGKIKDHIDFAFQSNNAEEWFDQVEADAGWMEQSQYVVNFVIFRTNEGKSFTVLDSFEDIPSFRFILLHNLFRHFSYFMKPHLTGISLGSIYHMIPVRESAKGQIDVGRVISLYKSLLSGYLVDRETIYAYASEALDKGMRQLSKSKIDNYKNLNLFSFKNKEDFYIKRIIMSYLVLMHTMQELHIINRPYFQQAKKEEQAMAEVRTKTDYQQIIIETENFIEKQGFSNEAKALFYLGALVHRVAVAQYQKEHKTKPILKKIQFQGMNPHDVLRLYEEVVEKLRQYGKMTLLSEQLLNRFHYYHGPLRQKWFLSDHANVFYIMSGYSYMVGTRTQDLSGEEVESLKEMIDTDNL